MAHNAEATILDYVNRVNRPLNSQIVADNHQTVGIKKTAVQKALDSLAANGKIVVKEYGKQRIYMARQDQFDKPSSEELEDRQRENDRLQEQVMVLERAVGAMEAEVRSMESHLTLEEMRTKIESLERENSDLGPHLAKLRGGATLVSPEERHAVEEKMASAISAWRKRRRIFKDFWNLITENMELKQAKLLEEELGVEDDRDAGVDMESYAHLLGNKRSRTGTARSGVATFRR